VTVSAGSGRKATAAPAEPDPPPASARIISCTTDSVLQNGWSKDSFGREPVDWSVPADPDLLVRALLEADEPMRPARPAEWPAVDGTPAPRTDSGRLPVAVLGDGDFLMGGTAIWTAALTAAVAAARAGHCVLADVRVRPDGYLATGG
jgi:acetolactate synthase-1/2/3 large subunit